MRFVLYIVCLSLISFLGCKRGNMYEKEITLLDSTKIVLQVKLNELQRSEQSMQNFRFQKFEAYYSFLKSNIKDTIGRAEAGAIQNFVNSGKTIQEFSKTKEELIKQTQTCIQQIQKLSADLKQNNIQSNVVQSYCNSEKGHADELIKTIETNVKALNLSLNTFKNSLPKTEDYIKQINNGVLPTVVNDSE
jgi:hypothetical protein